MARSSKSDRATRLGSELKSVREARGLSLRDVESITGISNPYLSQLETGKIEKPNPQFLFKLAECYKIPFQSLMEHAGYITRDAGQPGERLLGAALKTLDDLLPEEEEELMRYLAYLRTKRS